MKKKKQQQQQQQQNVTSPPSTGDLKPLIQDYSLFFDKLIELIPAKFYLPNDDPKPWFQGLSKAAKASAKLQTKENIKKARRDRLDPDKSNTTTLDLLKQSIESKSDNTSKTIINTDDEDDEEEEKQIDIKPISDLDDSGGNGNRSVTYEELQQRLHNKLEELRANRGQGKRSTFERRDNPHKRKRDSEFGGQSGGDANLGKAEVDIEKHVEEATKGIEFGKVKIADDDDDGSTKKKMKGSKAKELERAKRLQEAKKDPEKGHVVSKKHSWKAATSRAAGVKVHDDPKILKQSIHKEKKRHEKNVGKWKERIETVEKMKGEKQQKRAGNIADRIQQKKIRKIAKREKKLMRPGFEGRKQGYINEN
ncbi:hypothetical protein LguiB_035784 [Lonicera macranthoides]